MSRSRLIAALDSVIRTTDSTPGTGRQILRLPSMNPGIQPVDVVCVAARTGLPVMMANQLAAFFAAQGEARAVPQIANHFEKFWDPRLPLGSP